MKATEKMLNELVEMGLAKEWVKGDMHRYYINIEKVDEAYDRMGDEKKRHGRMPMNRHERMNGKLWIEAETLEINSRNIAFGMGDEEVVTEILEDVTGTNDEEAIEETIEANTCDVNVITADYNSCYDPSACCNGGGYWQPSGECIVRTTGGVVLHVKYEDTSCGDFGDRWSMGISSGAEEWYLYVDEVGTDADRQADYHAHNAAVASALERRFEINVIDLIRQIHAAISGAARNKYWDDQYAED